MNYEAPEGKQEMFENAFKSAVQAMRNVKDPDQSFLFKDVHNPRRYLIFSHWGDKAGLGRRPPQDDAKRMPCLRPSDSTTGRFRFSWVACPDTLAASDSTNGKHRLYRDPTPEAAYFGNFELFSEFRPTGNMEARNYHDYK